MSSQTFENRNLVLVCGMHRSGTSAVSGILHHLGLSIGKHILPPAPDNPKGFFENRAIVNFNTTILHKLDLTWDSIYSLPPNWRELLNLEKLIEDFNSLILEEFSSDVNIIIKDPRINILLPIYKELFLPENVNIVYVVRNPVNVIQSLITRNSFKSNKCALMWLIHNNNIIDNIDSYENYIIDYDKMTSNPINEINNIIDKLSINTSKKVKEKNKIIKEFIDSVPQNKPRIDLDVHKNLFSCINRVYTDLLEHKRIDSTIQNSILKRSKPFLNYHKIYEDSSYTNSYYATVILFKNNYPFKRIRHSISIGTNIIEIQIQDKEINRISVIPTNKYSIIKRYPSEYGRGADYSSCDPIKFNVNYEHGIKYLLSPSSYFLYEYNDSDINGFRFTFDLISINRNTLDELSNINNEVNNWIKGNIESLKNQLQETTVLNHNISSKLTSQDAILETKNQIIFELESELSSTNEEYRRSIQELKTENETVELFKEINTQLSNKLNNTSITLKGLQKDLKKSKKSYKEAKLKLQAQKEMETTIKEKEKEILKLTNEYKIISNELVHLENTEVNLKEVLKENNAINEELYRVKSEFTVAKTQLLQLQESKNKLEALLAENTAINKELIDLKIKDANSNKEIEYGNKEIDRLNDFIKNQTDIIGKLKSDLSNKSKEIDAKKSDLTDATLKKHQLDIELNISNSRTEGLYEVIDNLNDKLGDIQNNSHTLNEELVNSMNLLSEKNRQLEEASKTHAVLEEQIHHLNVAKNEEIQKLQVNIDSDNSQDKVQTELIRNKLEELEAELNKRQNDEKAFRDHISAQKGDIDAIKESISYRIGFGVTSPIRWVYDRTFNRKNTWVLGELARRGLKNPAATIKQISPKNFSTLKKALSNEPGQAIIENFDKLITHKSEEIVIDDAQEIKPDHNRQKILYISPHLPDYDTSSGGKRATRMIALMAEEFDLYVYTKGNKQQKYIDKLHEVGAIVIQSDNIDRIKKRIPKFTAIVYAWYSTVTDCKRFMDLYPTAKIIIDTVDVHWLREQRSIGIWEGLTQEKVDENKRNEVRAYKKADVIWTVTENDKQEVLSEIPGADIRVVSNIHDNEIHSFIDNGLNTMLFIGGYNHYPNISAAKLAAETILPMVRESIPEATLVLAGSHAPEEIVALGKLDGVEYKGFIPDEEIEKLYEDSFISIAPLLAGAGIKGKICEAIMYRTPVATNAIGNEGIDLINEQEGLIADEPEVLAKLITRGMQREFDLNQMTHNAQEKLKVLVGSDGVKTAMIKSIMPEISICIVTWNRKDLVERCIQSIEGNTKYPFYKILVHSNGCEDGTQGYLKAAAELNDKIIPILSETNEVFVKPNNGMMRMFPDNDSVLVNNDVYVTEGWLTSLYNAAYSSDAIGIAGSKILYPDNTLQEFGSELYEDGTGRNIGKWDDPNKPEYKKMKRVGYVSGCSLYIKKTTIDKIGVFDEQFHPCYCEDSDLCYTAWENGLEIVVTPESIIYHDEGGTSGTDEDSGFKAYQKINFEKFLAKHRHNLAEITNKIKSLN